MEWKHQGVKIQVSDSGQFYVPELERMYETKAKAVEAIDRHLKESEKSRREKLALPCLEQDGTEIVVTGFHAGHGHVLTSPKRKSDYHPLLYADTPKARALLAKRTELYRQIDGIVIELDGYKVDTGSYGDPLDTRYQRAKDSHAKAVQSG